MTSSRGKRWTPDEDAQIKAATWAGYPRPRSLARQLGRTVTAVMQRAAVLRQADPSIRWGTLHGPTRPWTKPQEAELKRLAAGTAPLAKIAASLGRTSAACQSKLGSMHRRRRWTDDDHRQAEEMRARGAKAAEIAAQLGRTVPAVHWQIKGSKPPRRSWTAADDAAIIEGAAARTSMATIAEQLGRTVNAVRVRANRLRRKGASAKWLKGAPGRRPWTTRDVRELVAMRGRGESYPRIAAALGRTVDACVAQMKKHRARVGLGRAV